MTLLAPWALWLSTVGLVVAALYLLKIRRRRQTVPALDFWRRLSPPSRVRSLFHRLKRWISLLLWLAVVAALVLAVGNPILTLGPVRPETIAVVVDASASMQAAEPSADGRTRLALAREAVAEMLDRRPVQDEWMLIEAGRQPRVRQALTRDRAAVREAAEAVEPFAGPSDLEGAVRLAGQLLEGRPRPRIVVVSDGAAGQVPALAERDPRVTFWAVGRTDDNLGIARLSVRTHRAQASQHVYARVVNASAARVEARLVYELDGSPVRVEPLAVEPGAAWEKADAVPAPQGGVLRVWIDRPDALAVDNEAYAVMAPVAPAKVWLVSRPDEAFFFEQALAAMAPLVDPAAGLTLTPEEYAARPPKEDPPDLVVFNNCAPPPQAVPEALVVVNAWPAGFPGKVAGTVERPDLVLSQSDHPLTRYLQFGAISLARALRLDLAGPATVLAQTSAGAPLIVLCESRGRRALGIAFDVLDSDIPFRNAFPLLLRNAVSYLAMERARWLHEQYRTGDILVPLRPLPSDVTAVRVVRPGKKGPEAEETVPVRDATFVYDRTRAPGTLRFAIGAETVSTAVNLVCEEESRIRPDPAGTDPAVRMSLTGRVLGLPPWLALAAAATVLVAFEWLSYHMRWTE